MKELIGLTVNTNKKIGAKTSIFISDSPIKSIDTYGQNIHNTFEPNRSIIYSISQINVIHEYTHCNLISKLGLFKTLINFKEDK